VIGRRVTTVLLAVVAAVGLLGTPVGPTAPAEALAAGENLDFTSDAWYLVQPEDRRIRVTVDLHVSNPSRDTVTKRFYHDHAFVQVMAGASGFKVSWGGSGTPHVRVIERRKHDTLVRIDFAKRLYSGKSATYRLTFYLKDPGGAATRDLRVGDSLVSFPVWAFATKGTPGSTVTVVFPKGYEVEVEAGKIPAPTTDEEGSTLFRSGRLAKPLDFFAYLVANRPGAYRESSIRPEILGTPVEVRVRAWEDDPAWAKRVTGLLKLGLPALGTRIGLEWPTYDRPLTVQEAVSRTTGGYAGLFDPRAGKVEIAYYADDFVVLHEAAHAWFNGALLADRWANEAFASYYATIAAADVDHKIVSDKLTPELEKARIPLNAWGPVGSEDVAQEDYAYAAALTLARAIAERAGDKGLQAVWADAQGGVGAYQPAGGGAAGGAAETVEGPPDWRGLLDLLEERTDAAYTDLWREWVARGTDLSLLDARAQTRQRYAAAVTAAGDWQLPRPIRDALRAWRFSDATALLSDAETALAGREAVNEAAADAGLIVPASLKLAFEDDDGFDDSKAETRDELDVIGRYVAATALRPTEQTPVLALGLWGLTPEARLAEARTAFAKGDLAASAAASDDVAATWTHSGAIGQSRAISIGLIVLAVLIALTMIISTLRRRRRRRRHVTMQATRLRG
jgi:hypothetical protein